MKYSKIIQFLVIIAGSAIFLITTPESDSSIGLTKEVIESAITLQDLIPRILILIFLIPTIFLIKNTIIKNIDGEKRLVIKNYLYLSIKLLGIFLGYYLIWSIVNFVFFLCLCA